MIDELTIVSSTAFAAAGLAVGVMISYIHLAG